MYVKTFRGISGVARQVFAHRRNNSMINKKMREAARMLGKMCKGRKATKEDIDKVVETVGLLSFQKDILVRFWLKSGKNG